MRRMQEFRDSEIWAFECAKSRERESVCVCVKSKILSHLFSELALLDRVPAYVGASSGEALRDPRHF